MTLPKHLADKRDEGAKKEFPEHFTRDGDVNSQGRLGYEIGFDACYALTSEREKMLIDELTEIKGRAFANSQEPQAGRYLTESPEYWRGYQAASCAIENFADEALAKLKETE